MRWISAARIFITLLSLFLAFPGQAADRLLVFAPASLAGTIDKIADAFTTETGRAVAVSVAGTPQLARQLEAGAPADIFISADAQWMNWLRERKLLSNTSFDLKIAGNSLVVAVRRETENWVDIEKLLTVFHRLVDIGYSLLVIEHH